MLYILTALHAEAEPFIKILRLKKDMDDSVFPIYKNTDFILCEYGADAAAAVGYLFGLNNVSAINDIWLLLTGVCRGGEEGKDALIYPYAIRGDAAGRVYYPDILYRHDFTERVLASESDASAYRAANRFLPVQRIFVIKSTNKNMQTAAERILPWLDNIQKTTCETKTRKPFTPEERQLMETAADCSKLTHTMRTTLERQAAAYKMSGGGLMEALKPFIAKTVSSKQEGKAAFTRLKESLIFSQSTNKLVGFFNDASIPATLPAGFFNKFSHIYVEHEAFKYPFTTRIVKRLDNASIVPIAHYKDIFNRAGQDFNVQRHSPKLVLAVRQGKYLFPGANLCDHYGHARFFYAAQIMNCLYDCEYCYLRGMYGTANIVVFVNTHDYFTAAAEALPAYVSISYNTDLQALEGLFGLASEWVSFAAGYPSLTLELRTKSAVLPDVASTPPGNVILAWTISPEEDAMLYEKNAPSLKQRLSAVNTALDSGWRVRLCADPLLITPGWESRVDGMVRAVRQTIDVRRLHDISVGGFRMPKTYYDRMRRIDPFSFINTLPLTETDGVMAYAPAEEARLKAYVLNLLWN
jgi:spore photoproduct lyase